MAEREIHRLTARKVETVKTPGVNLAGKSLRLIVGAAGAERWRFRFRVGGEEREMGLGGLRPRGDEKPIALALARDRAAWVREIVASGRNPIEVGLGERVVPMFGEAADQFGVATG